MRYTDVVFDLDGTLIDTIRPLMISLHYTALELLDIDRTPEDLSVYFGIPGDDTLLALGAREDQLKEGMAIWHKYYDKYMDLACLFPGVKELLSALGDSDIRVGVISSKTRPEFYDQVPRIGLPMDFFDTGVFAGETEHAKPASDPMFKYLELTGADPKKTLFVGDTKYDMMCAGGAGTDTGLATWGCIDPDKVEATYKFKSPADILTTALGD